MEEETVLETAQQKPEDGQSSSSPVEEDSRRRKGWRSHSQRHRKRPRVPQPTFAQPYNNSDASAEAAKNVQAQVLPLPLIHGKQLVQKWVRVVKPYPYTYATYAKSRWIGRTVLDVYHTEFGSYPQIYYQEAIEQGRIKVGDNKVDLAYLIKGGDVLTHTVHRHEPAVAVSLPDPPFINIITETDDLLVVDKPGTLPIHACGGYHLNALMPLLESVRQTQQLGGGEGITKLYTIHRLDRLTSGLVLLAKSSTVAQQWAKSIQERSCQKVYLARVKGKFPKHCPSTLPFLQDESSKLASCGEWPPSTSTKSEDSSVEALRRKHAVACWIVDSSGSHRPEVAFSDLHQPQHCYGLEDWMDQLETPKGMTAVPSTSTAASTSAASTSLAMSQNMLWLTLACPTRVAQHKDGICEAGAFDELDDDLYRKTVKPAQTSFAVIHYDVATDSTIVLCRPETGRTHQIRLHLQYLGHSIANDPNYGGELWYADPDGQAAYEYARAQLDAATETQVSAPETNHFPKLLNVHRAPTTTDVPATAEEMNKLGQYQRNDHESAEDFIQRTCVWCARSRGGDVQHTLFEFLVRSRGIWLHAIQYTMVNARGEAVSYRTAPPDWANP